MKDKKVQKQFSKTLQVLTDETKLMQVLQRRDFAESMLVFWGVLEYCIDWMVATESGVEYDDVEAAKPLTQSFERKIKFLKGVDIFTESDLAEIAEFYHARNNLFHNKRGKELLYFTLSEAEKQELVDKAQRIFMTIPALMLLSPEYRKRRIREERSK